MSKRYIYTVLIGFILLTLLTIKGLRSQIRFQQWTQSLIEMTNERELSVEEIRPTFLRVTKRELPSKADNLRATFHQESREPCIFVKFETDSEGIAYILQEFGGERVTSKTLDTNDLRTLKRTNRRFFNNALPYWQNEHGVCLFDQDTIESCRVLEYRGYRGYKILIDNQKNTVYIFAYRR